MSAAATHEANRSYRDVLCTRPGASGAPRGWFPAAQAARR